MGARGRPILQADIHRMNGLADVMLPELASLGDTWARFRQRGMPITAGGGVWPASNGDFGLIRTHLTLRSR